MNRIRNFINKICRNNPGNHQKEKEEKKTKEKRLFSLFLLFNLTEEINVTFILTNIH